MHKVATAEYLLKHPPGTMNQLSEQLLEINRQYHDFNQLHLWIDDLRHKIRIMYSNEEGQQCPLSDWMDPKQGTSFLQNYQQKFCLDPKRLERFFEMDEATAIIPIDWLKATRKRNKGISNAFFYMREAYQGLRPKRKPILVDINSEKNGLFNIVDGNSSYHVARRIGMKAMPAKLNQH